MYINEYYETVNKLESENGSNVAKIIVSLNEQLIRKQGTWAPRYFTGIADIVVKFDEDYQYSILSIVYDDLGEFYEHDHVTDFVYSNLDASNDDMKKLERYVEAKLNEVIYGPQQNRRT